MIASKPSVPDHSGKKQWLNVVKNSLAVHQRNAAAGLSSHSAMVALSPALSAGSEDQAAQAPVPQQNTSAVTMDIPPSIVNWLAQLTLLYGVPFEYLVPDAAMLPAESIRFFYIDQNWTNRLIDGAVNIALGSSQDYVHVLTTFEQTAQAAALAQHNVRAMLRGKPQADTVQAGGSITGVLLRSAVVSGWPGLEVCAYSDREGKVALPLLRMDRLSDNVLLCLFNGVPQMVNFSEPPEGLHFGVIGNPSPPPSYQVALRGLGGPDGSTGKYPAGQQINNASGQAMTSPISFRNDNRANGVLDINLIRADLVTRLNALGALQTEAGKPIFTSSQFAVQMVKGAGLQKFETGTGRICNGNQVNP